jgi:hypothetical protein
MAMRSRPFASVLALAVGWTVAIGCGSGGGLPVHPSSGAAGTGGVSTAGASGASAAGTSGAAGGGGAGSAGGTAGATTGTAGAVAGAGGGTAGAGGNTAGAGGGTAGVGGGTAGVGGASGAGGAPACTGSCPALACPEGSAPTLDPSIPCCPVCKSVKCASTFTCATVSCLPGTHAEVALGQCCAGCVPNAGSCDQARVAYMSNEEMLLQQFGGPCHSDKECTFAVVNNGCVSSCLIPLTLAGASMFDSVLRSSADACNTVCGIPAPISCSAMQAVCTQGRCAAKP